MSKKTPVKKSKRRLKRSVRRSFAAALMITAIAVAAIPVPENVAAPDGDDTTSAVDTKVLQNYAYPEELPAIDLPYDNDINVSLKLKGTKEKPAEPTYTTYYISSSGSGDQTTYTMNWQFDFFMRTIQRVQYGVIYDYNYTSGSVPRLEVPKHPIYQYVQVTLDELNTFIRNNYKDGPGGANPGTVVVKDWDRPGTDTEKDNKVILYYGQSVYDDRVKEWQDYDAALAQYNKDLAAWESNPNHTADTRPKQPTEPDLITKYASEFGNSINEQWRRYYCERTSYTYVIEDADGNKIENTISLGGYILEPVVDAKNSGAQALTVYIPRKLDGTATDSVTLDEHGFLVQDTTSIIGIAEGAFKDVQNVQVISLDSDIHYIGDSAFEGSFIQEIETYAENIGNRAFYNCRYLTKVSLQQGVKRIGTEAFGKEPLLTSIAFPASVTYVGLGAFADCSALQTVDFSKSTDTYIDDYAFYDDIALNEVNFIQEGSTDTPVQIDTIGKAAFAVTQGITGSMTEFVFPSRISRVKTKVVSNSVDKDGIPNVDSSYSPFGTSGSIEGNYKGLGDYIFAGRVNLQNVQMPSNFGSATEQKVPDYLFFNCIALELVKFPHTGTTCGLVTYDPEKLFATVSNSAFCVEGPELMQPTLTDPAYPRKATWEAQSGVSKVIPYIYYDRNGKKYTEVSNGDYLQCIDENGVLISCVLKPPVPDNPGDIYLPIPAEVAGTKVTGIASDCFKDEKLNQNVKVLTILDDSALATISDSVFTGWKKLEKVYIGNSVRSIGANAFADCSQLTDVTFNTPESAAAEFQVGANAFKTNSASLTFHGLINENYAPYTWAMQPDNQIGVLGIRVCYKSLMPTYQTVMYNGVSQEITLLDYPKYDQVGTLLGESYATKNGEDWRDGFSTAEEYYNHEMEEMYYELYAGDQYNYLREAFKAAWDTAADAESVYTDFAVYGPWVTPDYVKTAFTSRRVDTADAASAFDWLFEPLTVEAASGRPQAYFARYPYNVYENYERPQTDRNGAYQAPTMEEAAVFEATQRVKVPDGVTSIDVFQYINDESNTAAQYLTSRMLGSATRNMYYDVDDSARTSSISDAGTDYKKDIIAGLFSGMYKDKKDPDTEDNTSVKGNDRLLEVDLNQVTSIPSYAFDSCEKLNKVTVGAACTDMGELPFRGCSSLTTLNIAEENPKYFADNRILYSRNDTDSYKIEECLETRGKNSDNSTITSAADVNIAQVTEIARAAFEECNDISTITLTDATGLTVIPENCFKGCDALSEINLPLSVNKIDKGAFYDDLLRTVKIPGREVFISTNAFKDEGARKTQPTHVVTYNDSSARRYADTYGKEYKLEWEDIGDLWDVNFYDSDGTLLKSMQVQDGWAVKTSEIPEAKRDGYVFDKWIGTNNANVEDEITQDTDFIAQYYSNSTMVDGKWEVDFFDGVTGDPFWPTQLVPDGETIASFDGASFPPTQPYHAGYKFTKYVATIDGKPTDFTDTTPVTKKLSVIALYEVDGAGSSGGNTNTSGGTTTNTSGNTTRTSTSSTSTSNTSGSSTSTTSSTGAKPRHTVTVVNGYGSGSYAEGETVIIVANEPAAGQKFSQWRTESEGVELVMILASATTFVMPENNVLVTAEFTGGTTPTATTPTPTVGTVATNTGGNTTIPTSNNGNTRVDITKPGISNKNLATANVNGSTDNFIVKISETPEATQAVINALNNKYGSLDDILYYAMDISLYDSTGTTKITDTTGLSVDITIPLPDALVTYGGNNMMGAVVNSDQLEDLSERFTTIAGVPCVSFTATHFSPYTVYVNTQNLSEGLLDVTPKTGDPIHPKWFLSLGLASLSIILFMKKDRKAKVKTA